MKFLIISIISWLVGLAELLLPFYVTDGRLDLTVARAPEAGSLITSALFFALFNVPGLYWLTERRREVGASARPRSVAYALLLNAPVFLLVAFLAGRTLPTARALLFIGTLVIVSVAFGLGFVWSSQNKIHS